MCKFRIKTQEMAPIWTFFILLALADISTLWGFPSFLTLSILSRASENILTLYTKLHKRVMTRRASLKSTLLAVSATSTHLR